jgi:hypothetical protein
MRACGQMGNRAQVSTAVGGNAVVIAPVKNACAAVSIVLAPSRQTKAAPRVIATSTISAAGSALASDPPMVPRTRIGA